MRDSTSLTIPTRRLVFIQGGSRVFGANGSRAGVFGATLQAVQYGWASQRACGLGLAYMNARLRVGALGTVEQIVDLVIIS